MEEITIRQNSMSGDTYINEAKNFKIELVPDCQRVEVAQNPIFQKTISRANDMILNGVKVNSINFYVNENPLSSIFFERGLGVDDPEFWEEMYPSLGEYGGYKFLYIESSIEIGSDFVEPENISDSWNWSQLFSASIDLALDIIVENEVFETISTISSGLATALGSYQPPYNISYNRSKAEYLVKAKGHLYVRTFMIRDDLNRYYLEAYADWGTTERYVANVLYEVTYPISKNPGGTYEYVTEAGVSVSRAIYKTPGYDPNREFYERVIELYTNRMGFFKHYERVDVPKIIDTLLRSN